MMNGPWCGLRIFVSLAHACVLWLLDCVAGAAASHNSLLHMNVCSPRVRPLSVSLPPFVVVHVTTTVVHDKLQVIKAQDPSVLVLVDNCYGEFTEELEPTAVGAGEIED